MSEKFDAKAFICKLCTFSPRIGKNEVKATNFILDVLKKNNIKYIHQKFLSYVPRYKKEELYADGERIECKGASFVSGKINGKNNIISCLQESDLGKLSYNINFNPYANIISVGDFYDHPAVAIKALDIKKIMKAENVSGEVIVEKEKFHSSNILVGNSDNPKFLVFAHIDCIDKGGAIDNASGVSILTENILLNSSLLGHCLFIFSGSEEVSYDKLRYGGYGFRVFEKKYEKLIKNSKKIIVVDGVGVSKPILTQDYSLLNVTLQLKNLDRYKKKITLMTNDQKIIMKVYHSEKDTCEKIKLKYLKQASNELFNMIKNWN